jgi:uncharacterized protein YndB with AHSA1/START domain
MPPAIDRSLPGTDLNELLRAARYLAEALTKLQRRLRKNEHYELPDAFADFVVADLASISSEHLSAQGDDNRRARPSAWGNGPDETKRSAPMTDVAPVTSNAPSVGRILGHLRSADGKGVVRMEDRFDAAIDDLWSALTDPRRLVRWLGEVRGDLRLGGEFRARYHASGWEGTGRIEACEPPQRLLVRTKDADQSGEGVVEVTLTADGDHTIVVWEERGMPLDLLAAYGAGIQIHVEDLADHLAGRGREDSMPRFHRLIPSYQELAAHIGQ